MLKEPPYTQRFYSRNSKYISNALNLRPPQENSLNHFARLCDILSLRKNPMSREQLIEDNKAEYEALAKKDKQDKFISRLASEYAAEFYKDDLAAVKEHFKMLTSFERDFPSVCFALATGIGKTRLMGACIAYLRYEKGIKNFFVMAPNLTIYKKLSDDLGTTSDPKYVFRGLDLFVNPPRIIDGDNYGSLAQGELEHNDVVINVFNISKLNSDSKSKDGKPARIKRLTEILGQSYFSYLQSLPDLCVFMDESHHYHADKSFDVINELRPILGVELTATPQIQKGAKKIDFKNVIYEYSLAHALRDEKYVKNPVVCTRKNFRPEEYTQPEQLDREKLNDGLRLHEDTKSKLDIYARTFGKPTIKPFVLVVARDTEHSKEIMRYISSRDFFKGYYADKVMEINSSQRGAEKDENIEKLLSLESSDNKIEIVIHVNMLKEGWDVTNLYTIIPLRTSASDTLTEQTLGRGLRLPYGERTGDEAVDRLSVVSHDKYEAIVRLANDPDSIVRKIYFIDENPDTEYAGERETVELTTAYDDAANDEGFIGRLALEIDRDFEETENAEQQSAVNPQMLEVAKFMSLYSAQSVMEQNKQTRTINDVNDAKIKQAVKDTVVSATMQKFPEIGLRKENIEAAVEKTINNCVQALTDHVIPIPQAVIQPFNDEKRGFNNFKLDTSNMNWHPAEKDIIAKELKEGGKTYEQHLTSEVKMKVDTPENEVISKIIQKDNIDYSMCADLLHSLIEDAKEHFSTYLTENEVEEVLHQRQQTIAEMIYAQMMEHFYASKIAYESTKIRPFSKIETAFGFKVKGEDICDLRASVAPSKVSSKIFSGFEKACHKLYKFDSDTERTFAIMLENDKQVLKWMRPAPTQFHIYYGSDGSSRYEPDFVVETDKGVFIVETKARKDMKNDDVIEKSKAATAYCNAATEYNKSTGGKMWRYVLIPHDEVKLNSGFAHLAKEHMIYEHLSLTD